MVESIAPSEWSNWLMFFQERDEFLNGSSTLMCLHVDTIWSVMHAALELRDHCLKLWDD